MSFIHHAIAKKIKEDKDKDKLASSVLVMMPFCSLFSYKSYYRKTKMSLNVEAKLFAVEVAALSSYDEMMTSLMMMLFSSGAG